MFNHTNIKFKNKSNDFDFQCISEKIIEFILILFLLSIEQKKKRSEVWSKDLVQGRFLTVSFATSRKIGIN